MQEVIIKRNLGFIRFLSMTDCFFLRVTKDFPSAVITLLGSESDHITNWGLCFGDVSTRFFLGYHQNQEEFTLTAPQFKRIAATAEVTAYIGRKGQYVGFKNFLTTANNFFDVYSEHYKLKFYNYGKKEAQHLC